MYAQIFILTLIFHFIRQAPAFLIKNQGERMQTQHHKLWSHTLESTTWFRKNAGLSWQSFLCTKYYRLGWICLDRRWQILACWTFQISHSKTVHCLTVQQQEQSVVPFPQHTTKNALKIQCCHEMLIIYMVSILLFIPQKINTIKQQGF